MTQTGTCCKTLCEMILRNRRDTHQHDISNSARSITCYFICTLQIILQMYVQCNHCFPIILKYFFNSQIKQLDASSLSCVCPKRPSKPIILNASTVLCLSFPDRRRVTWQQALWSFCLRVPAQREHSVHVGWMNKPKNEAADELLNCSKGPRPTCGSEKCLGVNLSFQQKMWSLLHSPKSFTVDFKPGHSRQYFLKIWTVLWFQKRTV